MGALADLWESERGLMAVLLIVAATVFTVLGRMTVGAWSDFCLAIFGAYAVAKTVTGAAQIIKKSTPAPDAATMTDPKKEP